MIVIMIVLTPWPIQIAAQLRGGLGICRRPRRSCAVERKKKRALRPRTGILLALCRRIRTWAPEARELSSFPPPGTPLSLGLLPRGVPLFSSRCAGSSQPLCRAHALPTSPPEVSELYSTLLYPTLPYSTLPYSTLLYSTNAALSEMRDVRACGVRPGNSRRLETSSLSRGLSGHWWTCQDHSRHKAQTRLSGIKLSHA